MWVNFFEIDGISTRCLMAGDEGSPPLLLIHGHDLTAEVWLANIDALGSDFRVIAPDSLGNGFTGPVDFGELPAIAARLDHLVKLANHLNLDRFHVCGSSYGALLATLLSFELSERVDRLVINGSASAFASDEDLANHQQRHHGSAREILHSGPDLEYWRYRVSRSVFDPEKAAIPDALPIMLTTVYAQPWIARAWEQSILGMIDISAFGPYRVNNRIDEITAKTLIIWGRNDPGAAVSDAEIVVEKMPDGELLVFENCGHMIMFEHPERFNRTVRDFLLG